MKPKVHTLWKLACAVSWGLSSITVLANGFRTPNQDALATARGEAFTATADNASAIYYNPAGLTQLDGNNIRAGCYGIYLDPTYTQPQSEGGRKFHNDDNYAALPQFFYGYGSPDSALAAGLGVYSPFGLSSDWGQDTGFRTISTKGSITYVRINPAVGLKLAPNFSIGGGITVNYADADLRQGILWPAQPYDEFRFQGDGWGVGYNLGVLWKPHEKVSVGATFRSKTKIDLGGHTDAYNNVTPPPPYPPVPVVGYHSNAHSDFEFPLDAVFGISYRPTPKWNFEFDADYTDWSSIGTLTIEQSSAMPFLGIGQTVQTPLNWQPSWLYGFGVTRYLGNGWQISAGYVYNESSVPDAHYSPLVADLDRHFFSLGTGYKGKRFEFDVAYQLSYGPSRTVSGSGFNQAGQTADGQYDWIGHAILLTVGMHF